MKGSLTAVILIIVGVVIVVGMSAFILIAKSQTTQNNTTATEPVTAIITTKDFAPNLPMSQKTTILIQQDDSTEVKYIVPTSQVDTYVKSLPEGDHVISKTP